MLTTDSATLGAASRTASDAWAARRGDSHRGRLRGRLNVGVQIIQGILRILRKGRRVRQDRVEIGLDLCDLGCGIGQTGIGDLEGLGSSGVHHLLDRGQTIISRLSYGCRLGVHCRKEFTSRGLNLRRKCVSCGRNLRRHSLHRLVCVPHQDHEEGEEEGGGRE